MPVHPHRTNSPSLPGCGDPTKLAPGYGHLLMRDTCTPEEQLAAPMKESARRKGRGAKWWEKSGE
jgi:hypothetical protein